MYFCSNFALPVGAIQNVFFFTLHEMFKAPAVALNATGFLKKLQTKKEQSLGKEFQVFSFLFVYFS